MATTQKKIAALSLALLIVSGSCHKKEPATIEPDPVPEIKSSVAAKDYRDSVLGNYTVVFTWQFDHIAKTYTDVVIVRKPLSSERPFTYDHYNDSTKLDSCVTLEFVPLASNSGAMPPKQTFCMQISPVFFGSGIYNSYLDLRNDSLFYYSGCCGCGSKSCDAKGVGVKIP